MKENTSRQIEIINVSINLIQQKGIQHLTIKNISKTIGITEPAIYRHFKNKLDILKGILLIFKNIMTSSLIEAQGVKGSSLDKIYFLFSKQLNKFTENPAFAAVIFSEEIFQNNNILAKEVFTIMEMTQNKIKDIVSTGQESGEIRNDSDKEQLSIMIIGSFRFLIKKWHLSGAVDDLEKSGQMLWESIYKCIKK